jgi:hypothetical protein
VAAACAARAAELAALPTVSSLDYFFEGGTNPTHCSPESLVVLAVEEGSGPTTTTTLGLAWECLVGVYAASRAVLVEEERGRQPSAPASAPISAAASSALLVTPFCATAWNVRKREFLRRAEAAASSESAGGDVPLHTIRRSWGPKTNCGLGDDAGTTPPTVPLDTLIILVKEELRFTSLVQSRHRKAGEAWAHRRWCVEGLLQVSPAAAPEAEAEADRIIMPLLLAELDHCASMCSKYARNYLGWTHRGIVAEAALRRGVHGGGSGGAARGGLLVREWASTERDVRRSPSDFSAWHHRVRLLEIASDDPGLLPLVTYLAARDRRLVGHIRSLLTVADGLQALAYYSRALAQWDEKGGSVDAEGSVDAVTAALLRGALDDSWRG